VKPKDIYNLKSIGEIIHWSDSEAFFAFVDKEIDEDLFSFDDAAEDIRIEVSLKAETVPEEVKDYASCWVIAFDGKPVGIIRLVGRYQDMLDRYITDFPLYRAMVSYVKTLYTPGDADVVVDEDSEIDELEDLCGWVIDEEADNNMREV